jgi:hypothetical protein
LDLTRWSRLLAGNSSSRFKEGGRRKAAPTGEGLD